MPGCAESAGRLAVSAGIGTGSRSVWLGDSVGGRRTGVASREDEDEYGRCRMTRKTEQIRIGRRRGVCRRRSKDVEGEEKKKGEEEEGARQAIVRISCCE
jgi:hypothetical protein